MNAKLNESAERFALALRDMVREAASEAVEPVRADLAKLRSDMETGFAEAAADRGQIREEQRQLRTDMESGFAELREPK